MNFTSDYIMGQLPESKILLNIIKKKIFSLMHQGVIMRVTNFLGKRRKDGRKGWMEGRLQGCKQRMSSLGYLILKGNIIVCSSPMNLSTKDYIILQGSSGNFITASGIAKKFDSLNLGKKFKQGNTTINNLQQKTVLKPKLK